MKYLFAIVLFTHFFALYISNSIGFYRPISLEIAYVSTLDLALSLMIVYICVKKESYFFKNGGDIFQNYIHFLEKNIIFLLVILAITAYEAYGSMTLILSGVARHELIQDYDRAGLLYMFASGFFKILFPLSIYFRSPLKIKILAFSGLILSILITASRSELMYVINFFLILLLFSGNGLRILKTMLLVIAMMFIAIISTIFLQNRPMTEGLIAIYEMFMSVFRYKAYSYYLAEYSINISGSFEKIFYPFFGYVSDYFFSLLAKLDNPISSEFVGDYHVLGTDNITGKLMIGNVIYPWWSWFYGQFGILGVFIKAIYCSLLLSLLAKLRFMFTFVIIAMFVLFGVSAAHPFLTLSHTLAVFFCVVVDLSVFIYSKRKTHGKNSRISG